MLKRLIPLLLLSLACASSGMTARMLPVPAPTPERYYQAIGNVNIRDEPNGTVVGVLHTGNKVRSLGEVVTIGVEWCKHERGWSACEWLK